MSSNSVFVFRFISLFPELDFEARFTYSDVAPATGNESGDTTGTVPDYGSQGWRFPTQKYYSIFQIK